MRDVITMTRALKRIFWMLVPIFKTWLEITSYGRIIWLTLLSATGIPWTCVQILYIARNATQHQ
jgi:hypothetical protein